MTVLTKEQRYTPDDVLRLETDELYELVDGKLIEKEMSELANETAALITYALVGHVLAGNLGRVLSEQTYQCFPGDRSLIRRPDVSFIIASRVSADRYSGHIPIAPDIAVEVSSPNDLQYNLEEKLEDYSSAGIKLVWVVNPEFRTVMAYRSNGTVTRLLEHETLSGEDVLPGFAAKVSDLMPPRPAAGRVAAVV